MSSRSRGPARRSRQPARSSTSTIIITSSAPYVTQSLCSSPTKRRIDVVRLESDNDDETTTKRVKIAFRSPMKELSDAVELGVHPEKIQSQNLDGESSDLPGGTGHPQIHSTDEKQTNILDKLPGWRLRNLFELYHQPRTVGPDFGTPDADSVPITIPTSRTDMVKPGGPARPISTYGNKNKSVSTGANKPYRQNSSKIFDLTTPYRSSPVDIDAEHARKKQKTGATMPGISDTDDDMLYDDTRNQTASSRPPKSVSSNIPPLERTDSRHLHVLSEYQTVENTVSGKGRRRPEPYTRTPSNDSSRAGTVVIDDDGDEIEDSGPGIPRPPTQYQGSANRAPPRTKEERTAYTRPKRQTGPRSEHFDSYPNAVNLSNGADAARRTSINATRAIQNRRPSDEKEDISSDEQIKYKPNAKRKQTVMSMFTKSPDSVSMNREGDITPSITWQNQRTAKGKARPPQSEKYPTFPVKYLRTSSGSYNHEEGDEPWCFQYNPDTRQMDIVADQENISNAMETCQSYAFKPATVFKIHYSDENGQIVLSRPSNVTKPGSSKLLIELNSNGGIKFLQFLQKFGCGCSNPPENSDKMKKIFDNANNALDELDSMKLPVRGAKVLPEDIGLLRQNRIRKLAEKPHPQVGEFDSTRSNTKIENLDRSTEAPKTQRLHQRMRKQSPDSVPTKLSGSDGEEQTKKSQFQRIKNDYNDASPSTRSTRSQHREARRTSPSPPLRWTDQHRDWEKHWVGDESLIFPLEGKKQTPVDKRDIERLDEGEFLNDNLISFYLRYLEEKTAKERPDVAKRVFFMSSFFYQRLTRGKGRKNIDYEAVKRWTSKVNIFEFDYIVVPVNENAHWYVAIICNTPKLLQSSEEQKEERARVDEKYVVNLDDSTEMALPAKPSIKSLDGSKSPDVASKVGRMSIDDDNGHNPEWPTNVEDLGSHSQAPFSKLRTGTLDENGKNHLTIPGDKDQPQEISPSSVKNKKGKRKSLPPVRKYNTEEPRIITLDSLGLAHSPTCSNLREFLICEAKEKLGVEISLSQPSIGMTAKNIPEQDNYCDCGLFLLGYVEGFLDNPDDTIHSIMQGKANLHKHFPKMNATRMRSNMRDLIFNLQREQAEKEHERKTAKVIAKKAARAAKANEVTKSQSQTKEASSAPTSPESAVPSRPGFEFLAEPASTSKVNKVPEDPEVYEMDVSAPAEADGEVSLPFVSFMDGLAQYPGAQDKVDIPQPDASMQLQDLPETAGRRAILEKTPTRHKQVFSSQSPRPPSRLGITSKGLKQKYPSPMPMPEPKLSADEEVSSRANTLRTHRPSSPEPMQVDGPLSPGQDSLLDAMSPGTRRRATPAEDVREIPDSQTEGEGQQHIGQRLDAEEFEDILASDHRPLVIASPPAKPARRRTESPILPPITRQSPRVSGASAIFGSHSPRPERERRRKKEDEKRRKEAPVVVE